MRDIKIIDAKKEITLREIQTALKAESLWEADLNVRVKNFGAADLMSDVLSLSSQGMLLITSLTGPQVVRTAAVADLAGIIFVRGRRPDKEVVSLAKSLNIPLLGTDKTMFETCGIIYTLVNEG